MVKHLSSKNGELFSFDFIFEREYKKKVITHCLDTLILIVANVQKSLQNQKANEVINI